MWGINVINEHHCDLTGVLLGVTVCVDNGDTQYLTIGELEIFKKNRKENGYRK